MPLPRSLAHLKREIPEKNWAEARRWAGGRTAQWRGFQEAYLKVLPAEERPLPAGQYLQFKNQGWNEQRKILCKLSRKLDEEPPTSQRRWWKGDLAEGTIVRANELQLLVNQEARAITDCFRTTNLGALSMESGLRAAKAQLENRQPRFGLRLLSLPEGDQAREVVGAPT